MLVSIDIVLASKCTCAVGALTKDIGALSTVCKVCIRWQPAAALQGTAQEEELLRMVIPAPLLFLTSFKTLAGTHCAVRGLGQPLWRSW